MDQKLSRVQIQEAQKILSQLEPGFLPREIFWEFTRLMVTPIIELVPLRRNGSEIEIFMLQRDADDPHWPNMWHTPGTVLRSTDGSYEQALERIRTQELGSLVFAEKPQFLTSILHTTNRGTEDAKIYSVEISGEPQIGKFYRVDNLPSHTVATQVEFIQIVVQFFRGKTQAKKASEV